MSYTTPDHPMPEYFDSLDPAWEERTRNEVLEEFATPDHWFDWLSDHGLPHCEDLAKVIFHAMRSGNQSMLKSWAWDVIEDEVDRRMAGE